MEALEKRIEIARELYRHLPTTQKEAFGVRFSRLMKEIAEAHLKSGEEEEERIAALTRLVEELDHEMGAYVHPVAGPHA